MNRLKCKYTIALFWLGLAVSAAAYFERQNIHVVSFAAAKEPDRYTMVFDAETTDYGDRVNLPRKKRRFTVLLRCDPYFCTLPEYREAVKLLRHRIAESPDISIARMSGTGWRPMPRQRGVFATVGLRIPKPPNDYKGPPVLLFVHDDRF
jgi:hypothetical protein